MKHPEIALPRRSSSRRSFLHHIFPRETATPVLHLVPPVGRALTSSILFLDIRWGGKWTPEQGLGLP
jgi:hypothetical protein